MVKDRLVKRNWNGCPHCYFCNHNVQHIFLTYMLFASNSICHLVKIAIDHAQCSLITHYAAPIKDINPSRFVLSQAF